MICRSRDNHLTILGAGIAGLAAGYYAKKAGFPFTILESGNVIGGNCRTIQHNGFSFDTGAHRFHDKDPTQTREIKSLLGDEIRNTVGRRLGAVQQGRVMRADRKRRHDEAVVV